jgi:SAM-dependent methyltransferase
VEQASDLRTTFRQRLRYLPEPGQAKRLLDVGAAAGYFVEQARAAGWDAEGLEPSRWASAYAREQLRVPVAEGTLESAAIAPASFDVVTFWEVIEHVPSPRDFLADVARVLKPGGSLFLSTPDSGSLVARVLGRRWLGWNKVPEHLFFFDRGSLIRLLDQAGFDVFASRYVPLTVSWPYALERLGPSLGLGANAFAGLARALRNRSVTVNCYYDLMLAARLRR